MIARIPVSSLVIKDNVPAGLNPLVLMSLTYRYRSTSEDVEPATVTTMPGGLYRVQDGRHRFLASVIAGRPDVLCEIEE